MRDDRWYEALELILAWCTQVCGLHLVGLVAMYMYYSEQAMILAASSRARACPLARSRFRS
jgi:hypothetical protein